jgi:hypothetical protein
MRGEELLGFGISDEILAIELDVMEAGSTVSAGSEAYNRITYDQRAGAHA